MIIKAIVAAVLVATLGIQSSAWARVHRVAVDVTVQRCTAGTCRVVRTTWEGSAVAIGRIDGREYLLTCEHLFGGVGGETVRRVHGITIKTPDAGDFVATYHGGRNTTGTDGVDLALLSVESRRTWNALPIATRRPVGGSAVTVEGYPGGRWRRRGTNIISHTTAWGVHGVGLAVDGESGGAIIHDGKLAAILWGSRVGRTLGTFGTDCVHISRFVRGTLGKLPGGRNAPQRPTTASPAERDRNDVAAAGLITGRTVGPRAACACPKCLAGFMGCRAERSALAARLDNLEATAQPPADLENLRVKLAAALERVAALERKPPPPVPDVSGLHTTVAALRGLTLPVRVETAGGVVIRQKTLAIEEHSDGRLEFKPIVLKFDERILRGVSP